jgi:hypothetical protein
LELGQPLTEFSQQHFAVGIKLIIHLQQFMPP